MQTCRVIQKVLIGGHNLNFKDKSSNIDCIVSFAPSKDDFKCVRPGIYTYGKNEIVDKFVFDREKGAKLNIQKSQFAHHRQGQCVLPVEKRDPNPYLRNTKIRSMDGKTHITHYPENPDAPAFVKAIFNAAKEVIISKTEHGGYNVVCIINCSIRKFKNGEYSIETESIKPVPWKPNSSVFKAQLIATKEAKAYQKQKEKNLWVS